MKNTLLLFSLFLFSVGYGQIPAYYSSIDFSQTGLDLKEDLSDLITSTHTSPTSYSEVWDVLKESDLDPTNSSVVLLMYGHTDDGDVITDRTRDKNNNGGSVGQWNREHVFPKSLGSPNLGESGPGSDPHHLRASDVQQNGNRSNKKFAAGSGNAASVGGNWYPGNEWKGDAARMVMYMYLRYGNRCLPSATTVGVTNVVDAGMINLLLDWNAEDDVSEFEINRNNTIYEAIGNRNPFIDNPHIATHIWGGTPATDTWGSLNLAKEKSVAISVYPNPVVNALVYVSTSSAVQNISFFNLAGSQVMDIQPNNGEKIIEIDTNPMNQGVYMMKITTGVGTEIKKIIIK